MLVVLLSDLIHTPIKLVLRGLLLHLLHPLCPIRLHDFVIFEIPVILNLLLDLLSIQICEVVVILHALLLGLENLFSSWHVIPWLPVSFGYLQVLPLCCDSSCHFSMMWIVFKFVCLGCFLRKISLRRLIIISLVV